MNALPIRNTLRTLLLAAGFVTALILPASPVLATETAVPNAAQAARLAQKAYGGEVLRVRPANGHWRVRLLLESGRIKQITIDGKTGELKSGKPAKRQSTHQP